VFVLHFLDHPHISPDAGLLPSGIAALLHLLLSFSGVDMNVDVVGFSFFYFSSYSTSIYNPGGHCFVKVRK
jgi:hypothetical protein